MQSLQARRVLLAARVRLFRESIAHVLVRDSAFELVGAEATVEMAIVRAQAEAPEIVLLDASLPGSLDAVATFNAWEPTPLVIVIGLPESEADVLAFAEAGIAGYVGTEDPIERLFEVLHSAARGELLCSPRVAALMLRRLSALREPQRAALPALTYREHEIVELISEGLSNKQIGARLRIELATVKNHVHRILEKLQVRRRGEAAARIRRRDGGAYRARAERH